MSRNLQNIELGLGIFAENGLDAIASVIAGTTVPDGVSGKQGSVPIGSLYLRGGTGETYVKIANAGAPADWEPVGSSGATIGVWRPENVRLVTDDVQVAGTRDVIANPFSDDDSPITPIGFYTVNSYIIANAAAAPVLLKITAVSGDDVTFAAAETPLATNDTFLTRLYLPDVGNDQEGQAIVNYNGTIMVKVGDIDWNFADGISLATPYSASSGDITSSDSVQTAIEKLDGNNDAQDSTLGTAQGATNLGTFSGSTIPDSSSVKGALQSLETAHEEVDGNVNDLITLSGMPENSTDLGTFSGSTISDSQTVKGALQQLESAHETLSSSVTEIDANVDDLITLSGVPENSTNNGTFTGTLLADNQTTKALLQRIEDLLEEVKVIEATGITTATAVDAIPVASASACKWLLEAFEEATPANKSAMEVYGLNNGTLVDDTVYSKLKVGSNFNLSVSVDISGGNMRLMVSSSTAGVTVRVRRLQVTNI